MKRIYLSIYGGLGNQLYILAYGDYLQRMLGTRPYLLNELQRTKADTSSLDRTRRDLFSELIAYLGFQFVDTDSREFRLLKKWERHILHYQEERDKHGIYLQNILPPLQENHRWTLPLVCRISGYFQSYHYVSTYFRRRVGKFLNLHAASADLVREYASMIQPEDVAIHLRRGDFVALQHTGVQLFGAEHYTKGLALQAQQQPIGRVFVFSDDFEAIGEELSLLANNYQLVLVKGLTPLQDLFLLTCFRRYVLANSTFSWWGALCSKYADEVKVVVPKKPLLISYPEDSYFPPSWEQI